MPISLDGRLGIVSTGNIVTGNYFIGNGTYITNVQAQGGTANSLGASGGTISFDPNGNILLTANGVANIVTVTANGLSVGANITATGFNWPNGQPIINGNGSVTSNSITATGNITGGNIISNGVVTATGNITGANLVTSGALVSSTANITGNAVIGNVTTTAIVSNTVTSTTIDATGNITGGNLTTAGTLISATATVSGNATIGNVSTTALTSTTVDATGNVTGGNLVTSGVVTASGNVTGGNLTTAGALTSATATVTGNATVGNLITSGTVTANGASFTGNILMNNFWVNSLSDPVQNQDGATKAYVDNRYVGINGVAIVSGANIVANVSANVDNVSTSISAGGNIEVAPTYLSTYTGNISANNISSNTVTAVANISAGNLVAVNTVSSANVAVSNVMTIGTTVFTANAILPAAGTNLTVGGNAVFLGNVQVQGNLTTVNSNISIIDNLVWESANAATDASQANGGGLGVGPFGTPYASLLYNSVTNQWNTNIGLSANGNLAANGNISGGNAILTGNILANNATFTSNVSVGNLTVAGSTAFNTISANLVTTSNVVTPLISVLGSTAGAGFFLPTIVYSGSSTAIDSARLTLHLQVGKPPTNIQVVDVMVGQDSTGNVSYAVYGHINTEPTGNSAVITATSVGGLLKVVVDPNGLGTMYCTYEATEFGSTP